MAHLMCNRMICRDDKAVGELGYRHASLREMLEDCHRWLVAEGKLT